MGGEGKLRIWELPFLGCEFMIFLLVSVFIYWAFCYS